ncbi:bifunctional 5,10-methylenetetrahydrofolate dehydrogenase/5,10-methenyltetrahydrofolate cyclohydrolase [Feifania hominis]|uniref:Bifunctional protein FolD n=1 Tax=Feifania hominis TaxID=2763660 RepID=A0A926HPE7_9FIRM|nr:tetrahydrofolate dehydrogenase/cyclohydrolase catalytic domain-containing protein [Feifania hominis]MBC8535202.1 bifunctional 5,10-methylene-tetrahydrofolate dehydrogenase/5,10-methylene-tetrahydrofolate cyclohydrolase [Feifania hominis]
MPAKIIDGKSIAQQVRDSVAVQARELAERGVTPHLAVVIAGDDQASQVYVRSQARACAAVGIRSTVLQLSADITEEELLDEIEQLNTDNRVHGILIQRPLPPQINPERAIEAVSPRKDVDASHPQNVGRIMIGSYDFLPCTPASVMELLRRENVEICGRDCVVIGRSNIVGKPVGMLLMHENGTVTLCHSRTRNLPEVTRRADILVSAVGEAGFVTADMVKPGAVVIDVGMNRNAEGKLCGDVDFGPVSEIASLITPVPGGVGPMTITMLLENTIKAAKLAVKNTQECG